MLDGVLRAAAPGLEEFEDGSELATFNKVTKILCGKDNTMRSEIRLDFDFFP